MIGTTVRRLFVLLALLAAPILAQGPMSTAAFGEVDSDLVAAPATVGCPCTGGTAENEADCGLPTDTTNGGCNSNPNVFTPIACGETICGTVGASGGFRDTDWFAITLAQPSAVRVSVTAEFSLQTGLLVGTGGNPPSCFDFSFAWLEFPATCGPTGQTTELAAGTWWIFVAQGSFDDLACGAPYTLKVECPIHENDFETYPPPWSAITPAACTSLCGAGTSSTFDGCYCDVNCYEVGDCCLDACATCGECADSTPRDVHSCSGYCENSPDRGGCFCDSDCVGFNDCCDDVCLECGYNC